MPEEKERQEKEEKGGDEWGREKWSGEKWSSDPLGRFTWAMIIIWAGVAFLLNNLGDDGTSVLGMEDENVWAFILAGAGVLLWFETLLRLAMPAYRRPLGGRLILGTVLVVIGVGGIIEVELWPLILVAIGISMLIRYVTGSQRF
jgi:preprotein translocase subunit SecG